MIDGWTSDFDGGTFFLTGVVTLLRVARTATGGGAALLWRDSTASRPLDSITSLAALRKAIKNKSLSNAENWGIDALTSIICCLVYCFGSTNPRAKTIRLISVPRISLCGQDPCGCWAMLLVQSCSTLPNVMMFLERLRVVHVGTRIPAPKKSMRDSSTPTFFISAAAAYSSSQLPPASCLHALH